MDYSVDRTTLKRSSTRLTLLAHFFGILSVILMLVWLLHYREGIEYDSDNPARVFNVHPFLMFCGFLFLVGEGMMAYKTVYGSHYVQKVVHGMVHMVGLVLGIVGICAVFRFHDMQRLQDMVSLHSWIGLSTFILFCLQWVVGVVTYLAPKASTGTRVGLMPWHVSGGRALLYMGIAAALTGLMERSTGLGIDTRSESRLINFTGLSILLFGIFVDFSVALSRYA
ncbi:PREDICTED: probable transmembrane ascorbate ferrireductase 3 [Tarenaya hassleriana]|uniref:probable transmembrane ascorbate ferrireductase 3 n=1 Tax=Tarenaya hassleriana TaxID=28532 RepID=UPI00053C4BEB|nr:PREDICTED: probable transmembrane ascorbate ferrireductase 3 [Tarenaya hassleriana]